MFSHGGKDTLSDPISVVEQDTPVNEERLWESSKHWDLGSP